MNTAPYDFALPGVIVDRVRYAAILGRLHGYAILEPITVDLLVEEAHRVNEWCGFNGAYPRFADYARMRRVGSTTRLSRGQKRLIWVIFLAVHTSKAALSRDEAPRPQEADCLGLNAATSAMMKMRYSLSEYMTFCVDDLTPQERRRLFPDAPSYWVCNS
jgi:hypothetical protein